MSTVPITQSGAPDLSILAKQEIKLEGTTAVNGLPLILQSVLKGSKAADVLYHLELVVLLKINNFFREYSSLPKILPFVIKIQIKQLK